MRKLLASSSEGKDWTFAIMLSVTRQVITGDGER